MVPEYNARMDRSLAAQHPELAASQPGRCASDGSLTRTQLPSGTYLCPACVRAYTERGWLGPDFEYTQAFFAAHPHLRWQRLRRKASGGAIIDPERVAAELRALIASGEPVDVALREFRKGRTRQPDERFVADCGLPPEPEAARVALAVRRAVGSVGLVDPQYIRADDAYPDQLGVLPLWDSIDWLLFFMKLEQELGTHIPDREAQQFFEPDLPDGLSVREMAVRVYAIITRGRAG